MKQKQSVTLIEDKVEDQTIYVETRFKEIASNQFSIYHNESKFSNQFKNVSNECDMLADSTIENYCENSAIFSKNQKIEKTRVSLLRPFQQSNRNNSIELIDLTDC